MFWGLIMESNKKYSQTIDKSFHISMASLDVHKSTNDVVQINAFYENTSYLLCSLKKDSVFQVPLDLNFLAGTKISFSCNGSGRVYLTGYLVPEDDDDEFNIEDGEDDEDIPRLIPVQNKRKANEQKDGNKSKKSKFEQDEDEDDEDDDEDSEMDLSNDVDEDDSDEEEEDDEGDDDEEEEDSEEEEIVAVPEKLSKKQKQKQNQNQNQSQNQQQNKKEKNKLMNGSDSKSEKEDGKKKNKDKDNSKTEAKPEQQQKKRSIEGGVQVEDIKVGNGAPAKSGKFVSVFYTGRLKNGKKFDQTLDGEGFKFRLGKGEVIKGWDVGIAGMKVGGKRRLVIPPHMAYGAKGSPPVIPPNSQLTFEVELKNVN